MTIVAFEKEVSLKSKTIVRQYSAVLNLKKTSNIYKWKEKVQKNTGRRRKVQVTKCLQRTSSLCFLHGGELALF